MKFTAALTLAFATLATASPVASNPEYSDRISDIIGNFLPALLGNIESIAQSQTSGNDIENILDSIGIVSLPARKAKRSNFDKRSTQEQMNQVTHVISTLANGAIGFAKYAHLDSVADMLSKVDPELAVKP